MKKMLSTVLTVLMIFMNCQGLTIAKANMNYSIYEGRWVWENTIPYIELESKDNWYDHDEAYIDILEISGNKIKFEFFHQKGGVHLFWYDICEGEIDENKVICNTNANMGGPSLAEFKITLTLNHNSVEIEAYNITNDGVAFKGICYRQSEINPYIHYNAVIKYFNNIESESIYSLYDFDQDGILELIVDNNEPHATRNINFYKFDTAINYLGFYQPGYGELCKNPNGVGIITYHAYRNSQWLELLTYNNNIFVENTLTESQEVYYPDTYEEPHEIIPGAYRLETCPTNNNELLKKAFGILMKKEPLSGLPNKIEITCGKGSEFIELNQDNVNLEIEDTNIAELGDGLWDDEPGVTYFSVVPKLNGTTKLTATSQSGEVLTCEVVVHSGITVMLNDEEIEFDQQPIIKDNRTLVPLRAIFEAMGATVEWNNDTKTVTSTLDATTIKLTIGSNILYKNGTAIVLDVPAQLINGYTMVPARAVAEAFGADVDWDGDTRTVYIDVKMETHGIIIYADAKYNEIAAMAFKDVLQKNLLGTEDKDIHCLFEPNEETYNNTILMVKENAKKGDITYFYYAGHGDDDGGIYPDYNNESNTDTYMKTPSQLIEDLKQIPGTIVLILESCHSGAIQNVEGLDREKFKIITSSQSDQYSDTDHLGLLGFVENKSLGAFSEAFLNALGGLEGNNLIYNTITERDGEVKADYNKDNNVSFAELFRYIDDNMDHNYNYKLQSFRQDPTTSNINDETIIFSY